jgi:hypothetical protein
MIAVVQFAWICWFWTTPLPNATPADAPDRISRGLLLFSTTPGLNPNFVWSQSLLGQAFEELSGFPRLTDRLPVVAVTLAILAAAAGLGIGIFRAIGSSDEDWAPGESMLASVAVGVAAWGTMTLLLGRLGYLEQSVWMGLVAVFASLFVVDRIASFRRVRSCRQLCCRIVPWPAWPFVVVMLLASMLPTIDFDCIEYHLQGPKEYWQAGKVSYLEHNIYTNMPFGVEMLHLSAMSLAGDWKTGALAGQLLIGLHGLVTAGFLVILAQRWGAPCIGWWAALFYLSTPWTYRLAAIPYVEGPLCAATIAWVWSADRAWRTGALRDWGLVGVMAGWAMSCKYTAILPVVAPCALVMAAAIVRWRSAKPLLGIVLGGGLIFGPWLAKNFVDTGNPAYPLAWSIFGGIDRDAADDAKWTVAHGRKPLEASSFWNSIVDVAGRNDWQSAVFLAFAPLAVLAGPSLRRPLLAIGALTFWVFLSWWLFTHRLDRFWLPIQPLLALLAGAGAAALGRLRGGRAWRGVFVAACLVSNWLYVSTALAGLNEWTTPLETLWRSVPQRLYPAGVAVDQSMTEGDKALLVGQAAVFYWEHPILYNTVFNRERIELIAKGKTSAEIHTRLHELGVTLIHVDWAEIERYRRPGNYGFTDFVTHKFFDGLVRDGVLSRPNDPFFVKQTFRVLPMPERK